MAKEEEFADLIRSSIFFFINEIVKNDFCCCSFWNKGKKTYYHLFYSFHLIFRENPVAESGFQFMRARLKNNKKEPKSLIDINNKIINNNNCHTKSIKI